MHITGRKNVNQKTDKRNKTNVNSRKMVNAQTEIRAEIPDLNPSPKLVENRLIRKQRALLARADAERNHKRDDAGHADRRASYNATEQFAFRSLADEPIYNCAEKRRENY